MKKVLFTGVALMAMTATTFAQFNDVLINQSGNRSDASATQTGSWNLAQFKQNGDGTSAASTNKAVIVQTGKGTFFLYNNGIVDQEGHGHEVRLTQLRDKANNYAKFIQRGANSGAFATQDGLDNVILSNQRSVDGTAVEATIEQKGNRNRVEILGQTDVIVVEAPSTAFISQNGNDNQAYLTQLGDGNVSSIEQRNNWNWSRVRQNGVLNKVKVEQTADLVPASSPLLTVDIEQNGRGNSATTRQTGISNTIRLYQGGNFNTAYLYQSGFNQTVRGLSSDTAIQNGTYNTLETNQSGFSQTVYSAQNGNYNSAYVAQSNN